MRLKEFNKIVYLCCSFTADRVKIVYEEELFKSKIEEYVRKIKESVSF